MISDPYVIYGNQFSLFTRKLEAALIFYGVPHEMRMKNAEVREEVEHRSGTHQVPVLQTPENWMIGDTTPIMQMLDARYPARQVFPNGPLGVLVHIVEDYLDEWIARTMVHYRWHYKESAQFASLGIAAGDKARAEQVRQWGPRACRATGTDSEIQQKACEDEYVRFMSALEVQLGKTKYALGDRPTAVDCMLLGVLRAHTYNDPDPKRTTSQFKRVVRWCEVDADGWDGTGDLAPFPESTPFAQHILSEMPETYSRFVLGTVQALKSDAKAFVANVYGEDVSYLTRQYPARARQMVIERIENQLDDEHRAQVDQWLENAKLAETFGSRA